MNKPHILYVEDDQTLSFVTKDNLEEKGYRVTCCHDGEEALKTFSNEQYDLCILDVMLPKIDGFTIARKIREKNENIPVIFLTAKSMKEDKIQGFKTGGDDYITKPFSIEELIMKIEVFLKRSKVYYHEIKKTKYTIGNYLFDFDNLLLSCPDNEYRLTSREAQILRMFCEKKNHLLKREEILKTVWGNDDYFLGRSMDVFISKLRKYLKHDPHLKIENFHGVGFKLVMKDE